MAHGADEADLAGKARERAIMRGAVAERGIIRRERPVDALERGGDLRLGAGRASLPQSDGHELNEAHSERPILRKRGESDPVVLRARHGDAVELEIQPRHGERCVQAIQHLRQAVAPGALGKARGVERIETEIDAVDPGVEQGGQLVFEIDAVGRERDALHTVDLPERADEVRQSFAYQRLAAGELEFRDAEGDEDAADAQQLLIAQDLRVRQPLDALLGHTVGATKRAAIRDGDAEIVNVSAERINHGRASFCRRSARASTSSKPKTGTPGTL